MLPRKYRLPAKEFQYVYKKGTKFCGKYGMFVVSKSNYPSSRFGYVVSKKIGNAVVRHRFTRILRNITMEAVKDFNLDNVSNNYEFISFVFCNDYKLVKEDFYTLIKKSLNN